ncbi:MAG: DUF3303 family protein [Burkholderiales bacterium]
MLFAVMYSYRESTSEVTIKRLNALFANWQPPKGYEIKVHYSFADGSGGLSLVETGSEAVMYEALVPWAPFVEFRVVPAMEIEKAFPIGMAAVAWRESVKN